METTALSGGLSFTFPGGQYWMENQMETTVLFGDYGLAGNYSLVRMGEKLKITAFCRAWCMDLTIWGLGSKTGIGGMDGSFPKYGDPSIDPKIL